MTLRLAHFLTSAQQQPGNNIFMLEQIPYEALHTYAGQTFFQAMGPLRSDSEVSEVSI